MKISMVATVLNEERTIVDFMKSVIGQSKKPDEFIILDGGSKDETYDILKKYSKEYRWLKVFQKNGASRGYGRNFGVKKSTSDIIAFTDAGCILDKNWLKNITSPFTSNKEKVDVVVGIYKPYYKNDFQYFQGLLVIPEAKKIFLNPSRMSIRSMAMRKEVWNKYKYPSIEPGDDTLYNITLIKNNQKFSFAEKAIVYWRMKEHFKNFLRQFYKYGIGDGISGNIFKMKKNFLFLIGSYSYLFFMIVFALINFNVSLVLLLSLFVCLFLFAAKIAVQTKKIESFIYIPLLELGKRTSYLFGVSRGLINRVKG